MTHPQSTFVDRIPMVESAYGSRSKRRCHRRQGFQLLELVISMSTASILMASVGGAIIIANRAVGVATSKQATSTRNQGGLDRLRSDLAEAFPATSRSATGVTLSVADRTGDGVRDTIQYRWNGANNPLERSINAGSWRSASTALDSFEMDWRTCDPQAISAASQTLEPANAFVFQSVRLADNGLSKTLSLPIGIPETYQSGDLLVAAIAVAKDQQGSVSMPAGWTKVLEQPYMSTNSITLAVFYTLAGTGNSVTISWIQHSEYAYATLAHFRVGSASPALTASAAASGNAVLAAAPASSATVDNSLVLRFVAAPLSGVPDDETNIPGHVAITMRSQTLFAPAIGLAYRTANTGAVSAANFALKSQAYYATATLVFRP